MGPRRRRRVAKLALLLSIAAVVVSAGRASLAAAADVAADDAAADAAVCDADDPRQECRTDDEDDRRGADDCADDRKECKAWSENGECDNNPTYMLAHCKRSCDVCDHEFDDNDFGRPQLIPSHLSYQVKRVISRSVEYMQRIKVDPDYSSVWRECRNTEENCSHWALGTGCDDNPKYMKMECAPACQSCDYVLEMKKRCAHDPEGKDAIEAGGMDALFERMVRQAHRSNWQPAVLSRPAKMVESHVDGAYDVTKSCGEDVTNPCDARYGPWVITLENFVTPEEISVLLKWGAAVGYERSQAGDEIVSARTSSHAWCNDDCYDDPVVSSIRQRIAAVTGIPEENYECLQLLKYVPGTYYRPHNDFIQVHAEQSHGPRLLTFFVYFNEVEKGGGTRFPKLGDLTVQPRRGRVLIWPSVTDGDLRREDKRTEHEAMPVEAGEKYAANAWIHTRDFQAPFDAGCPS